MFLKLSSLRKVCGKDAESLAESLKPLIFKDFTHFITLIPLVCKCIEMLQFLPAKKNRAKGWGRAWGGFYAYA